VDSEFDDAGVDVPLLPADNLLAEATAELRRVGVMEEAYVNLAARWVNDKDSAGLLEPFGLFNAPPPPFGTASTDTPTIDMTSAPAGPWGREASARR